MILQLHQTTCTCKHHVAQQSMKTVVWHGIYISLQILPFLTTVIRIHSSHYRSRRKDLLPLLLEASASYYTMKLQVTAAAAVCLVLLVASEMVVTSQAAACDIYQMVPCMAASKNANVMPSQQCCANVAKMGQGAAGANCLCSLLSNSLARSQGVVPRIALGIPQKCRIPVPKGFVCQGIHVPGS